MTIAEAYRILAIPSHAQRIPARSLAKAEREAEQRLRECLPSDTLLRLDHYRTMGEKWTGETTNHAKLAYRAGLREGALEVILSEHERFVLPESERLLEIWGRLHGRDLTPDGRCSVCALMVELTPEQVEQGYDLCPDHGPHNEDYCPKCKVGIIEGDAK